MANKEKITFNISVVDSGKIDYLIEQGIYSNRSDFFSVAIKRQINSHEEWLSKEFVSKTIDVGIVHLSRDKIQVKQYQDYIVVGKLIIDDSVTLEELKTVYHSIKVYGKTICSKEIMEAYNL